jgi:hypothetical protein
MPKDPPGRKRGSAAQPRTCPHCKEEKRPQGLQNHIRACRKNFQLSNGLDYGLPTAVNAFYLHKQAGESSLAICPISGTF